MQWFTEQFKHERVLPLSQGEVLFRPGDSVKHVYWLEQGSMALNRVLSHGEYITVSRISAGKLIAEASLFSTSYHCEAVADQESLIKVYSLTNVLTALQHDPTIIHQLGKSLAQEIMLLRTRIELSGIHSAPERVLSWLKLNADANGEVKLTVSLKSIAAELGLAHETFYRSLKKLDDNGLIQRVQGAILLQ